MFIRIAAYQIQRMRINLSGESSGSITENSFEIQQKSENSEEKNEIAIDQLKVFLIIIFKKLNNNK